MRDAFDRELRRLEEEVLRMGSEIEEHLILVVDAFIKRDSLTIQRMIDADLVINERRIQVGLDSLTLNRHPAAHGQGYAPDRGNTRDRR